MGTRRRLEAVLSLHLVLTGQICTLHDQARAQPDAPCALLFTAPEWQAHCVPGTAVGLLALFCGFLARKADHPPGHHTIARGLRSQPAALRLAEGLRPDWMEKGA